MGNLLFSPSGRINSGDFMKGALIVTAIGGIFSILPAFVPSLKALGFLTLILGWCWVVLWVKRYHDGGKSGWMSLIPILLYCVAFVIAASVMLGGEIGQIFELAASGASPEEQEAATQELMKGKELPVTLLGVVITLIIAFLFNGMIKGDAGDNQFGPQT